MLVPLTDSTNAYAAMMLELIRLQQTRNRPETRRARASVSRPKGVRGLFARFRVGRRQALASNPA